MSPSSVWPLDLSCFSNSNISATVNEIAVNKKSNSTNTANYYTQNLDDSEYECATPSFDQREEIENHDPLVKNTTKCVKIQKRKIPRSDTKMINNEKSIQETRLPEENETLKKIDELKKLMNENEIKLKNNRNLNSNLNNNMMCGTCGKLYKKNTYFLKHLLNKKCTTKVVKKNKPKNVTAVSYNSAERQYDQAGPSIRNNHSIIKENQLLEEVKTSISITNPELFDKPVEAMNKKTLKFKSTRDMEFQKFVKLAKSTTDMNELNRKFETKNLLKLQCRLSKLDAYLRQPLGVTNQTRRLNKAFQFISEASGLTDGGLWATANHDGAYNLIVRYMKAFMANVNMHCSSKCAMLSQVTLKEVDFRNNVLHDVSCAKLFRWKSQWMDQTNRSRVRSAVDKIFAEWTPNRLESYLLSRQYNYLRRKGVLELNFGHAPGCPVFKHVRVPDVTDPDFALLRSFCVTGYSKGYLDFLRKSVLCFGVPLLEEVFKSYKETAVFNEAIVLASVRRLNVAWFQDSSGLYDLSALYDHRSFETVKMSVRDWRDELKRFQVAFTCGGVSD